MRVNMTFHVESSPFLRGLEGDKSNIIWKQKLKGNGEKEDKLDEC